LRASCRRFTVTVDTAFSDVVRCCADERRPDGWITEDFADAYGQLHSLGWAHSVEVHGAGGELVGGLYGVAAGGLFAGESMFHRVPDASKVALVALVQLMQTGGGTRVLDVQWATDHLRSLGAVEVPRREYLSLLSEALAEPELPALHHPPDRVVIKS
jgi:leucyl/phenylalanyl-tRNA--protein transferase